MLKMCFPTLKDRTPEIIAGLKKQWHYEVKKHWKGKPPCPDGFEYSNPEEVWDLIENRYLNRYDYFISIEPEWSSTGIWEIPFPGSCVWGGNWTYEAFELPMELIKRFEKWQDIFNYEYPDPVVNFHAKEEDWDEEAFDAEGRKLAFLLKKELGETFYIEWDAFKEAKIK